uniref:BHLH domain-containing protein n=1 Tax=Oryza barthii TaxID=65489 RepID=A0A0D3HWF0_9ORYZ
MMSFPYSSGDLGEATAAAAVDMITLDQMFRDYDASTGDDLFELVWESCGGGEIDSGSGEVQPAGVPCCRRLLPGSSPEPTSEDEMAAWLSTIVTGSGGGGGDDVAAGGDHQDPAVKKPDGEPLTEKMDKKLPTRTEERRRVKRRRSRINEKFKMLQRLVPGCDKKPDGEPLTEKMDKKLPTRTEERRRVKHKARRNPGYAETHGLTEKRRRSRINEKFKMLQRLVPGCDKAMYPTMVRPAAVYPVVQPPPAFAAGGVARRPPPPSPADGGGLRPPPVPVFPFGAPVIPLVTMMMPAAAAAAAPPWIYPSSSTGDHHLLQGSSSNGSIATIASSRHRR